MTIDNKPVPHYVVKPQEMLTMSYLPCPITTLYPSAQKDGWCYDLEREEGGIYGEVWREEREGVTM